MLNNPQLIMGLTFNLAAFLCLIPAAKAYQAQRLAIQKSTEPGEQYDLTDNLLSSIWVQSSMFFGTLGILLASSSVL